MYYGMGSMQHENKERLYIEEVIIMFIQNWLLANKLNLDVTKIKCMVFTKQKNNYCDLKYHINNSIIYRVYDFIFFRTSYKCKVGLVKASSHLKCIKTVPL